ncbi:hypothetical protein BCR33DRAFT_716117 [Rhizoclosmatium globosum]|uniref:Uncharacterized protein n=1 Tax=Rhizoclosmatium globosum TaxID=329046 RepID=A0A1Y2CGR5_9FUNG|nr:hypothetical protein BCR33DRAFT_716117 [Rhizoclosmatium globosum]|eukprot:ORY46116.1 hypothetical protein BCR33DRAFT_716117 [Rhizoclosmatium globosum]
MSQPYQPDNSIVSFQVIFSAIYAFQLVGHVSFILFCETPLPKAFYQVVQPPSIFHELKPIHRLHREYNDMIRIIQVANIVTAFSNTLFERSSAVVKRHFHEASMHSRVSLVGCFLYFIPSVFQTIVPILMSSPDDATKYMIIGDKMRVSVTVAIGLFDLFLVLAFVRFLQTTKTDMYDSIDPQFDIIAKVGAASSITLSLGEYMKTCQIANLLLLNTMYGMKLALWWNRSAEIKKQSLRKSTEPDSPQTTKKPLASPVSTTRHTFRNSAKPGDV